MFERARPGRRLLAAAVAALAASAGCDARAAAHPTLSAQLPAAVAAHAVLPIGRPAADTPMVVSVALPLRDPAGLRAFLTQLYDPASSGYRQYLSVAEFTRRFGPSAADYDTVVAFFRDQGMDVLATSPNRYLVTVEGSVAQMERVFHVRMALFRHPTEARVFFSADREPTLDLAVPVRQVTGLDDFDLPTPRLVHRDRAEGHATGSGPHGQFVGSDIRQAYYGGQLLQGDGQSLGLMELAGYELSDVQLYFAALGQPLLTKIVGISTDGAGLGCTGHCNDGEQALDIEFAVSMAPRLKQVQVYVGRNAEDVLNRMASDNTSAQLSTSWGWGVREEPTDDPLFQEMAAQGQSFLTASGDYSSLKASGPWPEESAYLTGVGGTDVTTDGPGGAWKRETGWSGSAGGPSVDRAITTPAYQLPFVTATNGASKKRRNVPDVAGDGDTDNYICFQGACQGGWGGTSFASPIWTGFVALANEQARLEGRPRVGFLNPALYRIAGSPRYDYRFHDVVRGRSGLYTAGPSFDLVTGLGSPHGPALLDALMR